MIPHTPQTHIFEKEQDSLNIWDNKKRSSLSDGTARTNAAAQESLDKRTEEERSDLRMIE